MIKAIACAAVIAAVTLFAYFRGWLPIQSKAGAATQEQNHDSQPQSATSGADPSPSQPQPPIQPPVKEPPKGALAVFEFGDYEAAIPRLTEELAKDKGVAPLWAALATSYEKVGKMSEAVVAWNKLAENCPKAPERSVALTRMYLASEGSARVDAGMRLLREAGESTEGAAHAVAIADLADKNGRQVEAWEAVSLAVQLGAGNEAALVARCVAYADALAFSPRDVPELGTVYVVKSGDLVVNIAKRHKVDSGTISRVNKIQNGMIRPGQRLKILTAKPELEVSIKKLTLRLWLNGKLARQYAICSGHLADSPTPIGDFTLSTKLVNPEWTRPGQQAVPFGHPDNPLGTRWMGFAEAGYTSYGVHGTIKPETIGTHASNGCVRMKNESVEELFDLVPSGTKIHIHE